MTPNHQQAADAATPKAMFICAAFKIIEQGPYVNLETRERRKYVYRCDLDEGHEGDHVDQVLLVNWSQEPVSPPAASPEQAPLETAWLEGAKEYATIRGNSMVGFGNTPEEAVQDTEQAAEVELPPIPEYRPDWDGDKAEFELTYRRDQLRTALAESQRLRQELAKDDDTQAEMAKRIAELEKSNAKIPKMYVWGNGRMGFYATAQAYSVDEARNLLLEETGTTDGSCTVRARAIEQIRHEQPTIFYRPNAQFALTDSGELEEMDNYAEKMRTRLRAVSEALQEKPKAIAYPAHGSGMLNFCEVGDVLNFVAKLRAIVEGK